MLELKAIFRRIESLFEDLGEPLGILQAQLFDRGASDMRRIGRWGDTPSATT